MKTIWTVRQKQKPPLNSTFFRSHLFVKDVTTVGKFQQCQADVASVLLLHPQLDSLTVSNDSLLLYPRHKCFDCYW